MTEDVYFDRGDPIHSLLELSTNGGYHLRSRIHSRMSLSVHPESGIAATTGEPKSPINMYTGPCLMSPVDSKALKLGYNPVTFDPETETGDTLESYDEFVGEFLLGGGIPKLSQIIDHWGVQKMSGGTVVLVLEDEEWTDKVARFLKKADIDFEYDRVFEDVRTAYSDLLQETFRAYVCDLLDNDVEIVPVFTSEYSEDIDGILEDATTHPDVQSSYDEADHYFQRIAMYTSPIWLDFLETELGLEAESLDISDPIRFYDEFYNYEGSEKNIFREYQINYFDAANDDRRREILFVPPVLAPHSKGYVLENHAPYAGSITPQTLDTALASLEASIRQEYPNILQSPLSRLLTGFPNRHALAGKLLDVYLTESDARLEWKKKAIASVPNRDSGEKIQQESGLEVRSRVQSRRREVRTEPTDSTETILNRLYQCLNDDLRTVLEPVRRQVV